jgi:transcriptional regulator with XRE-family HTH domain
MQKTIIINKAEVKKISQRKLAAAHNIERTTLSKVLNNKRASISFDVLAALYQYFKDENGDPYPLPGFLEFTEKES